jgi:hypothetical protein
VVVNFLPFLVQLTATLSVGGCVSMNNVTVASCSPALLDAPTFVNSQMIGVSPAAA